MGANSDEHFALLAIEVSIHAPVMGANFTIMQAHEYNMFQSTHP